MGVGPTHLGDCEHAEESLGQRALRNSNCLRVLAVLGLSYLLLTDGD